MCQICGDGVGTTVDGDIFVACDVCGFPVCRPCYEYERKDGNQSCPQCKTKYKRHRGFSFGPEMVFQAFRQKSRFRILVGSFVLS